MISFYLQMFFVHINSSPCASPMCCAFFMKSQDNTCRNKVEIIMETQKVYLLVEHRKEKLKVCLSIICKYPCALDKSSSSIGRVKIKNHIVIAVHENK